MSKNPKVSVVIRTLDEEKFLGKVLDYLYKQTYKDFEVIIIDSGSKDKTLKIVKKYPVRLIKIKPDEFNFSYALNLGIGEAKGEYISIISGHSIPITDTWLEDGLKNLKDKKVAGVTGVCITSVPLGYINRELGLKMASRFLTRFEKQNTPWLTNTNSLIRKSMWKKYKFDESLPGCEDYDWGKEMLSRGYKIVKDPKYSVFHSHLFLNKPGYIRRWFWWRKVVKQINLKKEKNTN